MEGIIYKYTNKINGKVYIGQTIDEKRRKQEHSLARENSRFHASIRKYGFNNFEYKVLFRINCSNKQDLFNTLDIKEALAIKYFDSTNQDKGYNISLGGQSNNIFFKNKSKRIIQLDINKNKLREWNSIREASRILGFDNSQISKACKYNFSYKNYYWIFETDYNEETLHKLHVTYKKEVVLSNEIEPIIQIDLNGNIINEWKNIKYASKFLGISISSIRDVINHRYNTAGGYFWILKEDYDSGKFQILDTKVTQIVQFSIDGVYIREWSSISSAHKELKINNISSACNGNYRVAGGFRWKYKKDWDGKNLNPLPEKDKITEVNKETLSKTFIKINKNKKAVVQLDLEGNFIKEWDSATSAENELGISNLSGVCSGKLNTAGGFRWEYSKNYYSTDFKLRNIEKKKTSKKIVQLSLSDEFIKEWGGIAEAERETGSKGISAVCKGRRNIAGGFKWMYAEDYYGKKEGN